MKYSDDNTIKIRDAETGQKIRTFPGHSGRVTSVSFSPEGERIISGRDDNTIKIWDAETGRELLTLKGHTGDVNSVLFSPSPCRADHTALPHAAAGRQQLFGFFHRSCQVERSPIGSARSGSPRDEKGQLMSLEDRTEYDHRVVKSNQILKTTLCDLAQRMSDADSLSSVGGDVFPEFMFAPELLSEVKARGEGALLSVAAMFLESLANEIDPDLNFDDPEIDETLGLLLGFNNAEGAVAVLARAGLLDAINTTRMDNRTPVYELERLSRKQEQQLRADFAAQTATYEEDRARILGDAAHCHAVIQEEKESPSTRNMNAFSLREHLCGETEPYVLKRKSAGPSLGDEEFHTRAFADNPERYALESLAAEILPGQRSRVIDRLLRRERCDFPAVLNDRLDRVLNVLACRASTNEALTVFLALRRRRINRKAISQFMLRYLLNHPYAERLANRRRRAVVECIEHAVGRNVARACVKALIEGDDSRENYVRRNLLRFANDAVRAGKIVKLLYQRPHRCEDTDGAGDELTLRETQALSSNADVVLPRTVTATNRGDISATLVHLYRGGENAALTKAVDSYVEAAANCVPQFSGTVSLVLDVSASTRGYGEREFCCVSQSVAFRLVLEHCCSRLFVHQIGGTGDPPQPEGDTDLATAVLDALQDGADVIAVVSDGYENVEGGDLARVVAALEQMDVTTPIVFCHSKFTSKDSLEYRRPAAELPELEFWHERDFADVFTSLFAAANGEAGKQFVGEQLQTILNHREQEITIWTARNGLI